MMKKLYSLVRIAAPRQVISPRGFFAAALVLSLLFAVCHVLGWREYTGFLSGNSLTEGQAARGIAYALAYFSFAVAVPIMVLASAIFWLLLGPWRRGMSDGS